MSCAWAMLTIMTSKKIRASQGTDPTPQRRHGSGDTNAYAMLLRGLCSARSKFRSCSLRTTSSFVNSWIVTHRNGAALNTRTVARSTLGSSTGSLQFSILPTMLFVGVYDQCTSSGCMYVGAYVEAAVRGRLSTLTEARRTLATFVKYKFKVKGAILYPIS